MTRQHYACGDRFVVKFLPIGIRYTKGDSFVFHFHSFPQNKKRLSVKRKSVL
jgi:hypothetical protein